MSYDLEDYLYDRPLPSDITMRVPIYRRRGVLASLISAIVSYRANRRLRWAAKRYRTYVAPPLPDYLREDIGLPRLPPPPPTWWELQR